MTAFSSRVTGKLEQVHGCFYHNYIHNYVHNCLDALVSVELLKYVN